VKCVLKFFVVTNLLSSSKWISGWHVVVYHSLLGVYRNHQYGVTKQVEPVNGILKFALSVTAAGTVVRIRVSFHARRCFNLEVNI
jgi:hypothetical protein